MDIFKFGFDTGTTELNNGQVVNGLTSKMWVERYGEPGEFELLSPVSENVMTFLPLGTLISHIDTYEVMIVENHEIEDDGESDPVLKTTGRSLSAFLEARMLGADLARFTSTLGVAGVGADDLATQIVNLINDVIHTSMTGSEGDDLEDIFATTDVTGGTSTTRQYKPGPALPQVVELLKVDDLGIRTVRQNPFGTLGSSTQTEIQIYEGVDRTDTIIFSWRVGELEEAQYLMSIKSYANAAYVTGKWVHLVVDGVQTGLNRRFIHVDASDIDEQFSAMPAGGSLTTVVAKMEIRGAEALANAKVTQISQADISNISRYRYRIDFNVGDIVRLSGNFGVIQNMRITEYTEIEDENGESSHPTLDIPGA
jgi:hypothetical protein